jgi:prephenate dehydrogenase
MVRLHSAARPLADLRSERLAVVGTGLIGASVGLAAKRAGAPHVAGYDSDRDALATALERGALDRASRSLEEAVADADLVLVATPVAAIPTQVAAALGASAPGCTVTDVGSTKARVCASASGDARFIGGHPVCGSEAHGPEHAHADLFEGATWFLTPLAETEPARHRLVHGFVSALRAVPIAIEPHTHDRLVALMSHLPHALANILLNQAGAARIEGHDPLATAGGSLRDMTRVAGTNARVWLDIFLDNAEVLAAALAEHRRRVEELERALRSGDVGVLARSIEEAAGHRARLLASAYADVGPLYRIRVHVPDRPGVLSGITQALGAERINIEDFDLEHLSRERGGTLTLLIDGEEEANRAAALLEAHGYGVVVSRAVDES